MKSYIFTDLNFTYKCREALIESLPGFDRVPKARNYGKLKEEA